MNIYGTRSCSQPFDTEDLVVSNDGKKHVFQNNLAMVSVNKFITGTDKRTMSLSQFIDIVSSISEFGFHKWKTDKCLFQTVWNSELPSIPSTFFTSQCISSRIG